MNEPFIFIVNFKLKVPCLYSPEDCICRSYIYNDYIFLRLKTGIDYRKINYCKLLNWYVDVKFDSFRTVRPVLCKLYA